MANSIFRKEYLAFLHACDVLGCDKNDTGTPACSACWDAAYNDYVDKCDPLGLVCYHCNNSAVYCVNNGYPCTPYEYAVNMAIACSAVGKIEDAALFQRYADSVRPAAGVMRL